MATILVVEDEIGVRDFVREVLTEAGHEVEVAVDAPEAIHQLDDRPFDLLIVDLRMPGELGGMDVIRQARAKGLDTQILVLTAYGTVETAVEAMKLGAFDFLEKPLESPAELRRLVGRALNWRGAARRAWLKPTPSPLARSRLRSDGARAQRHAPAERKGGDAVEYFLDQLKRRKVYSAAASYAAAAFILLQAADLVFPVLSVPAWSYAAMAVLLMGGFPVALVLGWMYDIRISLSRTRATPNPGE